MGVYLNSTNAHVLYKGESTKPYFVDKSQMLGELFPLVDGGNNHICITRPRRFGKTVMANMIAAFFSKGCDARDIFQNLAIAGHPEYETYRNQFSVIHITFNELPRRCSSYEEYIGGIEKRLLKDLKREYPSVDIDMEEAVWYALSDICIILELKVDQTPEDAIWQIKDKKYAQRFQGRLGEGQRYTGRILAVGISYDRARKKHSCKIEVLL